MKIITRDKCLIFVPLVIVIVLFVFSVYVMACGETIPVEKKDATNFGLSCIILFVSIVIILLSFGVSIKSYMKKAVEYKEVEAIPVPSTEVPSEEPTTTPPKVEEKVRPKEPKLEEGMVVCGNCGALVQEESVKCPNCGAEFEEE